MSVTRCVRVMFLVLGLLPALAHSATYYVATSGGAGCSTNINAPSGNLSASLGCLTPGDTLYLRQGTYAAMIENPPGGTSWSSPVTIAGFPGETATLRPNAGAGWVLHLTSSAQQYIIFDNLRFDAFNVTYDAIKLTFSGGDITQGNFTHHIQISNSEIFNVGGSCRCATASGQLLLIEGANDRILNNTIHTSWGTSLHHGIYNKGDNVLIQGNRLYDIPGFGIHIYNEDHPGFAHDNLVIANRVHNTGCDSCNTNGSQQATAGILLSSGTNNTAYNNLVYNNKNAILIDDQANVYNNTIYGTSGSSAGSYCINNRRGTGTRAQNNLCYQNTNNTVGGGASYAANDHNLTSGNPRFVNAGGGDFNLQAGSPAIQAGVIIPLLTMDLAGTLRPQGKPYDLGAYAYGGSPPTPLRPAPP